MLDELKNFENKLETLNKSIKKLRSLGREPRNIAIDSIEPLLTYIDTARQSNKKSLTLSITDLGLLVDMIRDYQLAEEQVDKLLQKINIRTVNASNK